MTRHGKGPRHLRLPRGIAPDLLLSQVKNTIPYIFLENLDSELLEFPPTQVARKLIQDPLQELTHYQYFELCLSAHYLTCASFVPTDVDNQIRLGLWPAALSTGDAIEMARLTLASRRWDFSQVTQRISHGLSGLLGEWFTVSCAAYCALSRYKDSQAQKLRQEIFEAIADEVNHHSEVFGGLMREKNGLDCLKVSASIAHNLGDLDRVMDMWKLEPFDPLRLKFYKLGVKPFDADGKLRFLGRLWVAGELYKSPIRFNSMGSSMAMENHRHFALRKPKCLRKSKSLMIQTGPFLDAWGEVAAQELSGGDLEEVIEALKQGESRLTGTLGYGRALLGISGDVQAGQLSRLKFENYWNDQALVWIDEIPSKA